MHPVQSFAFCFLSTFPYQLVDNVDRLFSMVKLIDELLQVGDGFSSAYAGIGENLSRFGFHTKPILSRLDA